MSEKWGGRVRRDADAADPGRDKTVAAFDAAREGVGVEPCTQLIDARDRHGAIADRRVDQRPNGRGVRLIARGYRDMYAAANRVPAE